MHTRHTVAGWSRAFGLLGSGLFVSLILVNAAPVFAQTNERVRAFEQALRPSIDLNPEKRKADLEEAAKKLRGLDDYVEALLLRDWADRDPDDPADKSVDRVVRRAMLERFREALVDRLKNGDDATRAAALTLYGEFAIRARFAVPASQSSNKIILKRFPDNVALITPYLTKETSPEVFRAAILALTSLRPGTGGTRDAGDLEREIMLRESWQKMLNTLSKSVVAALESVLKSSSSAERRRLAAEGLGSLVRFPVPLSDRYSPGQSGSEGPEEIVAFGRDVVPVAAAALRDDDPVVRANAAEALQTAATFVNESLRSRKTVDRDLGRPTDKPDIRPGPSLDTFTPLLTVLWKQTKALGAASEDPNPDVRLAARRTLDALGETRQNWLSYKGPLIDPSKAGARAPQSGTAPAKFEEVFALTALQKPAAKDALLEPLLDTTDALIRGLSDDRVIDNRRAAAEALESILVPVTDQDRKLLFAEIPAERLAPSVKALVRALVDRDRFVRWVATRTLGRIGPVSGLEPTVVSGLARVLNDPDVDVQLQAALALALYGPPARDVVGALVRAAQSGDTEVRVEAVYAIQQTGAKNTAEVVTQLSGLLSDPIVRIRRAAAETLSTFGPGARPAKNALVKALQDPDPEVRRKASQAILQMEKEPR
jgi:HEAT repeat protein